ncbi:MAG: hypothetical protein JWM36_1533 [Hyphomicrobiales bacterium]|nr:hypothetical protein [Hyphomicrobiales bacterium]
MPEKSESQPIPLVEERVHVGKEDVVTGRVTIRTVSEEIEQIVHETLDREAIEVTRVPIGREVNALPAVRTVDGVVIVPVIEERLVVEKKLVLTEELHIRRHITQETVEVPVTLRKQRAEVERADAHADTSPQRSTNERP